MTDNQLQLFDPNLEPIRYIAEHGAFEFTLDGKFQTFWLTQKQIAELYNLTVQAVSLHVQNFKKIRADDINTAIKESLITAADGKVYRAEQYNHQIVIYIGYRAQATQETIRFQRFHEEVFRQRLEDEHKRVMLKEVKARSQKVTGYILGGMTAEHAERRMETIDLFKELSTIIARISSPKLIGQAVNKEYVALFGKLGTQLKEILNAKNIRDALPDLQLQYVQLAETSLILILKNKERMTPEELLSAVALTVAPLGQHLRQICDAAGIDLITGRVLLAEKS